MSPLSKKVLTLMGKDMSKSSLCSKYKCTFMSVTGNNQIKGIVKNIYIKTQLALSKSSKNHLQASKAH